jgi:hypothetical protein
MRRAEVKGGKAWKMAAERFTGVRIRARGKRSHVAAAGVR